MSLIDSSYFIGPLTIAQLGDPIVLKNLNRFIQINEDEFMGAVLGYELYDAMTTGLKVTTPDQKWLDLKKGSRFEQTTNFPGYFPRPSRDWYLKSDRMNNWVGFSNPKYQSPLAGYVYFQYMEDLRTQATGSGIVKAKGAMADTGVDYRKMLKAWNAMAKDIYILWLFLAAKGTTVYAEYDYQKISFGRFNPRNMLGL